MPIGVTQGSSIPVGMNQPDASAVGRSGAAESGRGTTAKVVEVASRVFASESPKNTNPVDQARDFLQAQQSLQSSAAIRAAFNQSGTLNAADANKLMMQVTTARQLLSAFAMLPGADTSTVVLTAVDRGHQTNQLDYSMMSADAAEREIASKLMDLANENLNILHAAADKNTSIPNLGIKLVGLDDRAYDQTNNDALLRESLQQAKGALESLLPEKFSSKWNYFNTIFRKETTLEIDTIASRFQSLLRTNPSLTVTMCSPEGRSLLNDLVQGTHLMPWDRASLFEKLEQSLPSEKTVRSYEQLGAGANGKVFLADFNGLTVIKKELSFYEESEQVKTFKEMAVQARAQNNHHIPRLMGFYGTTEAVDEDINKYAFNIITEYVEGGDVESLFEKTAATLLPERLQVALHMVGGAARGLEVMHRNGLLHMDIKPANLMLDPNTQDTRLIDFGEAMLTKTSSAQAGSPLYMAPEVMLGGRNSGPHTEGVDTWSLGATFAEGLGLDLFETVEDVAQMLTMAEQGNYFPINESDPLWANQLGAPVKDFIRACFNQDPMARPAMAQIVDALNGDPIRTPEEGQPGLRGDDRAILSALFTPDTSYRGREALVALAQQDQA